MFGYVSHPYLVQDIALWLSFVPCFAIVALIAGAQREMMRRTVKVTQRVRVRTTRA